MKTIDNVLAPNTCDLLRASNAFPLLFKFSLSFSYDTFVKYDKSQSNACCIAWMSRVIVYADRPRLFSINCLFTCSTQNITSFCSFKSRAQNRRHVFQVIDCFEWGQWNVVGFQIVFVRRQQVIACLLQKHIVVALKGQQWIIVVAQLAQSTVFQIAEATASLPTFLNRNNQTNQPKKSNFLSQVQV